MNKKLILALTGALSIFVTTGCGPSDEKNISEGSIKYEASVVDGNGSMAAEMAPDEMILSFKDDKAVAEMHAGMGFFSTYFISDPDAKTFALRVKIFGKK